METQSYYQSGEDGGPRLRAADSPPVPVPLRWTRVAVGALLVVLVVLPVLMTVDRGLVEPSILRDDPSLSGSDLDFAVNVVLAYTWILHAVYGLVAVWLTHKTLLGRRWARIALTVAMGVATLNSLDSAAAGAEYLWAVICGDVLQIAIIALLWMPTSSRAFFAAHRRMLNTDDRSPARAGS